MERRPEKPSTIEVKTTWGSIKIERTGSSITRCALPFLAGQPEIPFAIKTSGNDIASQFIISALTGETAKKPILAKPEGTEFQRKVWQAISEIPAGETITYAELAQTIGRPHAYRAVANACGKNPLPIFIPCHRVVAANGKIGGFSAGRPWKRLLLAPNQAS